MNNESLFAKFAPYIKALPAHVPLNRDDLLTPTFLLHKEGLLEIYYVPFHYKNKSAKVVLIGITPGWTQMEVAYRQARTDLLKGLPYGEIFSNIDLQASFAGLMRNNLIYMLDELELNKSLGIKSSSLLFSERRDLVDTKSAIRDAVFVNKENYAGHSPDLITTPILRQYVEEVLARELQSIADALVVPLGKCVSKVIQYLIDKELIDSKKCALGFPHPSGANAHMRKQFEQRRHELKQTITDWFSIM